MCRFRYRRLLLDKNGLVILVSQLGEVADTLVALKEAKANGVKTLADINDLNEKLLQTAHIVVFAVFTFLLGLTLKIGGAWDEMIIATLWRYVDETTKLWIQDRYFSWFDMGLNLIETSIGGIVVLLF